MKKIVLFILALMSTSVSYSQLTMRIDSIDISRVSEPLWVDWDSQISFAETPGDKILPCIQIFATIDNKNKDNIWIRADLRKKAITMKFRYKDKEYYKYGTWIQKNYYGGLLIKPGESKRIILWTTVPINGSIPQTEDIDNLLTTTYPDGWNWGRKKVSNRMYLRWLKEILPSLTTIITYDVIDDEDLWLISEPLDLKKVVVTSNLTDKKLN